MLKLGLKEKKILDGLLVKEAALVAIDLNIDIQQVYSTKTYFRKKVQNARDFLAVANSQYKSLITRRLKTPKIIPEDV